MMYKQHTHIGLRVQVSKNCLQGNKQTTSFGRNGCDKHLGHSVVTTLVEAMKEISHTKTKKRF